MNATMEILPFEHEDFGKLRVISQDGEPWFAAKDVCEALGVDTSHVRRGLDDDEVATLPNWQGKGAAPLIVSEAGLYALILKSRKPEAKSFKRWVTHEVLPSIRETGGYVFSDGTEDEDVLVARGLLAAQRMIERRDKIIAELRPKALLAEAVVEPSPICYTVSECARYLANIDRTIKRQDVFDELRSRGLMCKGSTAPTRKGIDTGRMVAVASEYREPGTNEKRAGRQRGHVTAKGLSFLVECLVSTEAQVA